MRVIQQLHPSQRRIRDYFRHFYICNTLSYPGIIHARHCKPQSVALASALAWMTYPLFGPDTTIHANPFDWQC
jgi:hypothetical protein